LGEVQHKHEVLVVGHDQAKLRQREICDVEVLERSQHDKAESECQSSPEGDLCDTQDK
jgi:hypothetical protein